MLHTCFTRTSPISPASRIPPSTGRSEWEKLFKKNQLYSPTTNLAAHRDEEPLGHREHLAITTPHHLHFAAGCQRPLACRIGSNRAPRSALHGLGQVMFVGARAGACAGTGGCGVARVVRVNLELYGMGAAMRGRLDTLRECLTLPYPTLPYLTLPYPTLPLRP